MQTKKIIFNGRAYYRWPGQRYYKSHKGCRIPEWLHRKVWEFYNGPIPEGYEVHHIDGDTDNNDIENLALLTESEHYAKHYESRSKNVISDSKRKRAAEWHRSEAGHRWHTRNSIEIIRFCPMCGKIYKTKPHEGNSKNTDGRHFCSRSCSGAYNNGVHRGCVQPVSSWESYVFCRRHPCS